MTLHLHEPRGLREALVAFLLRTLLRLALKPMFSPRVPLQRQRAWLEGLSRLSMPPFGARLRAAPVGEGASGRPAEWWTAAEGPTRPGTLLYLHGGAYCLGSPRTHRSLTGRLAQATGLTVCALDYRLAPEHPWPAALEDTLAAVRWLRANRPGPVVLGGDSAGGGLALAAAQALRDAGEPVPEALLLLSPWVEADFARVPPEPPGEVMLSRAWGEACARHVLAGADPRTISPLHAPLHRLPPVLIEAGTDEMLHDQAVALHDALAAAGVAVTAHITRGRWHVFPLHAGTLPSADAAVRRMAAFTLDALDAAERRSTAPAEARTVEVRELVMLGAGMSGLCLAVRLKQAGQHDFVVLEKSTGLGGTWWDNRYPGAHVDVPAPLYSFSFAPNPRWRQRFAAAPEIHDYMVDCAFRFGVRPHLRLGTRLTSAVYDEARGRWTLDTEDGRRYDTRFFVCSTGPLSQVRWPDLPGLESFAGTRLHSARWDATVPLAGRRIGVIGTGSTASQLVPPLAAQAAHLTVFQRTANWVLPRLDRRYTALDRLLARFPPWSVAVRAAWRELLEWGRRGFDEGTMARRGMLRTAELHRRHGVPDPQLRARLVPPYPLGCKRIIYSNDYYPALSRPNVALVTEGIEAVTPEGVRTTDGRIHALDVLVCATGFDTTHMLKDVTVTGRDGRSLAQAWADGPEAYRGVTVPGFPNFFLTLGPNTGTGHTSTLLYIEPQVDFILRAMARVRQQQAAAIEVRGDVHRQHNDALQRRLDGSVWSTCRSWYRTDAGKIVALWPGFTREYTTGLQQTDWSEFDLQRVGGRGAAAPAAGTPTGG